MNPSRFPAAFPFQQMLELHHQHQQQQQQQQQEIPPHQHSEDEDNSSSGNKELEHPHHHHLHHQIHHHHQQQQQQQQQPQHQQSPQAQKSPGGGGGGGGGGGAGSGGEVVAPVRKPRGRPPGSKNKPKPPIIITRDTGSGMRPHVLEIAPNTDIVDAIATFARKRQRALCVLSARGTVSNLTLLRHSPASSTASAPPSSPPSSSAASTGATPSSSRAAAAATSTVSFQGRFELISLSGAFLQQQMPSAGILGAYSGLAVSVAGGPQGQVLGGNVAGPLVSASPVMVIAASFVGPAFDRLPLDDQDGEIPEEQPAAGAAANPSPNSTSGQLGLPQHGNSSPPSIPIHQLMNDPFGLAAAAAAAHHHHHHHQIPPPELLASWAAAAAAGATRPPM